MTPPEFVRCADIEDQGTVGDHPGDIDFRAEAKEGA